MHQLYYIYLYLHVCTYSYNSPDLEFLVVLQSCLTVLGNFTCWWAAYNIYQSAQREKEDKGNKENKGNKGEGKSLQ